MALMSEVRAERGERWIKHYSSTHEILLVGEGDFSFSLCLALAFGSATNIVATSLDSYEELVRKYKRAKANLDLLKSYGATLLLGVDATRMNYIPDLQTRKFHRIIYNFPHAGFHGKEEHPGLIKLHRNLVLGFFGSARGMLYLDGEVHVSHKSTGPYKNWDIEHLAHQCSLVLVASGDFRIEDYPGYLNKRGAGTRCDEPFHLGKCKTFKFMIALPAPRYIHRQQVPIDIQPPLCHFTFSDVHMPYDGLSSHTNPTGECHRMFGGYRRHVEDTFGNANDIYDVCRSFGNALSHGYQASMGVGRPPYSEFGRASPFEHYEIGKEKSTEMLIRLDHYI